MNQQLTDFFNGLFNDIQTNINDPKEFTGKLLLSVGIVVLLVISERLIRRIWRRTGASIKVGNVLTSLGLYFLRVIAVLLLVRIWINALDFFILLLIGIVFLMMMTIKGLFSNITAWIIILNKHFFRIYDRIEIDDVKGQVIRFNPFYFTVMELSHWFDAESPTGRTIKIPNKMILEKPVSNYNELTNYVWKEIDYLVTFQSDWENALDIMYQNVNDYYQKLLAEHFDDQKKRTTTFKTFELFDGEPEPVKIVDVQKDGIALKIRYIVYYKEGTTVQSDLHQKILKDFANAGTIEMAGNRLYVNQVNQVH